MSGRILIVDDSAFVRKVFREILVRHGYDVVAVARDGLEALEKIAELEPAVVTLDLMMPHLDGLAVLQELSTRERAPAVVVVSASGEHTGDGITALARGAIAVIEKPTALATSRLFEIERALLDAITAALVAQPRWTVRPPPPPPVAVTPRAPSRTRLLVIGASTGGPRAISELLAGLPGDFPVPVVVVLHMPVGYTEGYAERLDSQIALRVVEAADGQHLEPGMAVIARAGVHTRVDEHRGRLVLRFDDEPATAPHRPSVDVLFESASAAVGDGVLAAVLTGMGDDGLAGSRAIHARGGLILTEAESSCVVWGMPRVVFEAGLSASNVPLSAMVAAILSHL